MDLKILKTEFFQDTKVCAWLIGVLGGNVNQGHLDHSSLVPGDLVLTNILVFFVA